MTELVTSFTSTGEKLLHHQEAMENLRNGKGFPISCWIAPTDVCNAKCSFCSVGERPGDVLPMRIINGFLDQLCPLGLKSVTLSGGGNPLLYKCKETGTDFNGLCDSIHARGLEMALITNGMPMVEYPEPPVEYYDTGKIWTATRAEGTPVMACKRCHWTDGHDLQCRRRTSWKTCRPDVLDYFTWIRISMAGLDHPEKTVYVPDIHPAKTTLGFSWIMSDSYEEPSHKHGWVSTPEDVRTPLANRKVVYAMDRLPWIEGMIRYYVEKHCPAYVRLLCNCLQPDLIPERHRILSEMAARIDLDRVFSQSKPPRQPRRACAKVYTRPCLNACGTVFCCDSVVLNKTAGHKFGSQWGVCRWDEVGKLFAEPIRKVIPDNICPGCVFPDQVDFIGDVIDGMPLPTPGFPQPQHVNFV
jgi:Fe-S oxidoreductases